MKAAIIEASSLGSWNPFLLHVSPLLSASSFIYWIHSLKLDSKHIGQRSSRGSSVLFLNREEAVASQPCCLISSVSGVNVASGLCLEVPWRDQNDVSDSNPDSSLKFSSDSAQALFTVLAFYHDSVKAEEFDCDSQHVVSDWQLHLSEVVFADNFPFSHFLIISELGE